VENGHVRHTSITPNLVTTFCITTVCSRDIATSTESRLSQHKRGPSEFCGHQDPPCITAYSDMPLCIATTGSPRPADSACH
jgi:hypothetical protein